MARAPAAAAGQARVLPEAGGYFSARRTRCSSTSDGNPEKIDIIYRFFELFDLGEREDRRSSSSRRGQAGEVAIAPPMRPFQEEKLSLALFHHHLLQDYWAEALSGRALKLLRALIPPSWVMDPAPLPPGAVLDGPRAAGAR